MNDWHANVADDVVSPVPSQELCTHANMGLGLRVRVYHTLKIVHSTRQQSSGKLKCILILTGTQALLTSVMESMAIVAQQFRNVKHVSLHGSRKHTNHAF